MHALITFYVLNYFFQKVTEFEKKKKAIRSIAGPLFSAVLLACTPSWSTRAQRPWSLRKKIGSPDRGQSQRLLSLQNQERILINKTAPIYLQQQQWQQRGLALDLLVTVTWSTLGVKPPWCWTLLKEQGNGVAQPPELLELPLAGADSSTGSCA